ncbi:hypothetical protein PIROE2DRAFT_57805 [Piromyces sp. E2]|nr:hypothetical protein PIROE2DRAFT_57805 [Piromyces sp. E2]|eukprot:OUM68834.1 hypothetical protein PIROE2DRAFT_57805 [Piromyces sp. E2]
MKIGIDIDFNSDIDDEIIIKENIEETSNNKFNDSETIIKDDIKESIKIDIDSSSSDDLDIISMDRNVDSLFGIVNENNKEEINKSKKTEKSVVFNKMDNGDKSKSLKRNNYEIIEKRKADMSIFSDYNSNKKLKPIFNLRYEIEHKDEIDRYINFDVKKLDEEYESKVEHPNYENKINNIEESSTNIFNDLFDEEGKAPLTKKETIELKEFLNNDQKKFSLTIVNLFPDFKNELNNWHHELLNNNFDNTNTKYLRNNKEKDNKNLYEMCLSDSSFCKLIVSQKLFYIYYKNKIKEFKDQYFELLLKIVCFERNIVHSRNAMLSIKDLLLNKETYNTIMRTHENTVKESSKINTMDNKQELIKLIYSPVDFFKKVLSFYGFRVNEFNLQINQIKNNIDDLKSPEKKIDEEIFKFTDSLKMFASCNIIQYNIEDNEELQNLVEKNIDNECTYLPIKNFKIIVELIELISIFRIIKTQLQNTIKHIVQSLDIKTWTSESVPNISTSRFNIINIFWMSSKNNKI